jgi:hypothetical protein
MAKGSRTTRISIAVALGVLLALAAARAGRAEEEDVENISSPPPVDLGGPPKKTNPGAEPAKATGPAVQFKFGSGELTARIEHPFRVVELETSSISATLHAERSDLPHGLAVEAHISAASLIPPSRLGGYLSGRLLTEGQGTEIVFRSDEAETLVYDHTAKTVAAFEAVFRGRLRVGGGEQPVRVTMRCGDDGPALKCAIHSRFSISGFGIPVPHMLWVRAKDEILVRGDVSFAPQG